MPWEQRDLARHHAEPGPSWSGARLDWHGSAEDLLDRPSEIEVSLPTGLVFENQHCAATAIEVGLRPAEHRFERAGDNPAIVGESRESLLGFQNALRHDPNIPGSNSRSISPG